MKKSLLTIALGFLGFATFAQSTSATHNVKVTAQPVLDIQMTNTDDVIFNFATATDYESGIVKNAATELKVKSTKGWTVTATGGSANFSSISDGNSSTEIPVSALSIGITQFVPGSPANLLLGTPAVADSYNPATFAALATGAGITAATGSKGGQLTTGNTFKLDYKMTPGYIEQDTYTMEVTYTISQN